jgi:integrase
MTVVKFPRSKRRGRYGDGTIVEQQGGRFRVQVSAGRDPKTGKRLRLSGYAQTKDAAMALKRKLCGSAVERDKAPQATARRSAAAWTVASWLDEWKTRTTKTKNGNSQAFRDNKSDHVKDHLGTILLTELREVDVRTLVNTTLAKRHCGMEPLSAQTRDHVRDVLHAALREAVLDEDVALPRNVATRVKVLDYDPEEFNPRVLSDAEYERFLQAAARYDRIRERKLAGRKLPIVPIEAAFVLLAERGLREGELLGLQLRHIDVDAGTLAIEQQLQPIRGGGPTKGEPRRNGRNLMLCPTKSKTSQRTMHLTEQSKAALRAHLAALAALDARFGTWNPDEMLFPTPNGIPMHPATLVHDHFHPICALAHITPRSKRHPEGLRVHDLRHTSATRMLRKTKDIDRVRRIHGWSSLKMVQRYVHLLAIDEELDERVAG